MTRTLMQTFPRLVRRMRLAGLALALGAAALPGCVTEAQVRSIVDHANASVVSSSAAAAGDWKRAVAEIDRFAADHADQPEIVHPLRVRQALILCAHGQDALAQQAFEAVDARHLAAAPRERALHRARSILPWWFRYSTSDLSDDASYAKGREGMETLADAVAGLPPDSDTRYHLEEMRALMALQLVQHIRATQLADDADPRTKRIRETLADGLGRFATLLGPDEFARAAARAPDSPWRGNAASVPGEFADASGMSALRRVLRPPYVIAAYRNWDRLFRESGGTVPWTPAWVEDALGSP